MAMVKSVIRSYLGEGGGCEVGGREWEGIIFL